MKQRSLSWTVGGAMVGAIIFGVVGYFFGKYGLVETDLIKNFPELRDPDGVGSLSAWLVGLGGLVFGMRRGRHIAYRRERAERRKRERESDSAFSVSSSTRPR